jgi:sialate O-acetylesterase
MVSCTSSAVLFLLVGIVVAEEGPFRMHKVISSHMVLQAEQPAIFGFAKAGDTITAITGAENKTTKTTADGKWHLQLDPRPATFTPASISVSDGTDTIVLEDVLFGDVWVSMLFHTLTLLDQFHALTSVRCFV